MNITTLLQLAERCEQEGPSRDIDACIAIELCPDEDRRMWYRGFRNTLKEDFPYANKIPRYTANLDAAMTLTNWLIITISDIAADGLALVKLGNPGTAKETVGLGTAKNANLAITFCAAALRARAEDLK